MSADQADVVPAGHHRLACRWWFWHQKKTKRPAAVWSEGITCAGKFGTVEAFWGLYSHMQRPEALTGSVDVMMFKDGIQPMWEDEANARGGRLTFKVKKGMTNKLWEEILLALVGDQFDTGSDICGAVLSVRYTDDSISIWNRDADNEAAIARARDTLARIIHAPSWLEIGYTRHGKARHAGATPSSGAPHGEETHTPAGDHRPTKSELTESSSVTTPHAHPSTSTTHAPRASPPPPADDGSLVRLPLPSGASKQTSAPSASQVSAPASMVTVVTSAPAAPPAVHVPAKGAWGKPAPSPTVHPVAPSSPSAATSWASAVSAPAGMHTASSTTPGGSTAAARPAASATKRLMPSGSSKSQAGKTLTKQASGEAPADDGWQTVASRR